MNRYFRTHTKTQLVVKKNATAYASAKPVAPLRGTRKKALTVRTPNKSTSKANRTHIDLSTMAWPSTLFSACGTAAIQSTTSTVPPTRYEGPKMPIAQWAAMGHRAEKIK